MKKPGASQGQPASQLISQRIAELGDWRGETLSRMRKLIKQADPDVVEEWKWMNPVWSGAKPGYDAAALSFATPAVRIPQPSAVAPLRRSGSLLAAKRHRPESKEGQPRLHSASEPSNAYRQICLHTGMRRCAHQSVQRQYAARPPSQSHAADHREHDVAGRGEESPE